MILVSLAALVAGCAPSSDRVGEKKKESVYREAIEGFSGKTAVDNLKGAKPKIAVAGESEKQKSDDVDNLCGQ